MSGFNDRLNKSLDGEKSVMLYLDNNNIQYARSGYECLQSTILFKEAIRNNEIDETAKRIRYFPDMIVSGKKKTMLLEVKTGITIEKDAYDVYMGLYSIGYNVGIIFINNGIYNYCDIENLKIKKAQTRNMPVVDECWIAPRKLEKDKYAEWKTKHPKASGTTFAFVDFDATKFIVLNETKTEMK